jgi:hypothetical protein
MSEIILFRPREGRLNKSRRTTITTEAKIMFFTGVRYERMADPPPALFDGDSGAPSSPGPGRGRRRRRG